MALLIIRAPALLALDKETLIVTIGYTDTHTDSDGILIGFRLSPLWYGTIEVANII